jgi:hypothetical protein
MAAVMPKARSACVGGHDIYWADNPSHCAVAGYSAISTYSMAGLDPAIQDSGIYTSAVLFRWSRIDRACGILLWIAARAG